MVETLVILQEQDQLVLVEEELVLLVLAHREVQTTQVEMEVQE
jgi:hypothetical protein